MTCSVLPGQTTDDGADHGETTHACPVGDAAVTACCGRSPFDLPPFDRLTVDESLVTCSP